MINSIVFLIVVQQNASVISIHLLSLGKLFRILIFQRAVQVPKSKSSSVESLFIVLLTVQAFDYYLTEHGTS